MRFLIIILLTVFLMPVSSEAIGFKDLKKAVKDVKESVKDVKDISKEVKGTKKAVSQTTSSVSSSTFSGGDGLSGLNISWSDNIDQVRRKVLANVAISVNEESVINWKKCKKLFVEGDHRKYWFQFVDYDWNYDPNESMSDRSKRETKEYLAAMTAQARSGKGEQIDPATNFTCLSIDEPRSDLGIHRGDFYFSNSNGRLIGYQLMLTCYVARQANECAITIEDEYKFLEETYGPPDSKVKVSKTLKWKGPGFIIQSKEMVGRPFISWLSYTAFDEWLTSIGVDKEAILEDMKQKKRRIVHLPTQ